MKLENKAAQFGLSLQVTAGCLVLAGTVSGQDSRVLHWYQDALAADVPAESLAEVARMAHLIGGIPRAIEGLKCFGKALDKFGIALASDSQELDRRQHAERGLALFERIYAGQSETVLANLEAILPGFGAWIIEHAYGRVLSRPQLPAMERELLALSALAAMRCPNQLKSHARGALHLGASREQVRAAIDVLAGEHGEDLLAEAHAAVDLMLDRTSRQG